MRSLYSLAVIALPVQKASSNFARWSALRSRYTFFSAGVMMGATRSSQAGVAAWVTAHRTSDIRRQIGPLMNTDERGLETKPFIPLELKPPRELEHARLIGQIADGCHLRRLTKGRYVDR